MDWSVNRAGSPPPSEWYVKRFSLKTARMAVFQDRQRPSPLLYASATVIFTMRRIPGTRIQLLLQYRDIPATFHGPESPDAII